MRQKKMDLSSCVLSEEDKKKVQDAICVLSNFSGAGSSSGASESASRRLKPYLEHLRYIKIVLCTRFDCNHILVSLSANCGPTLQHVQLGMYLSYA